jgi:toxin ParE1/3/4
VARKAFVGPVRLSGIARRDYREILKWSAEKFGVDAASRYQILLIQAMLDLQADPERYGSREGLHTMTLGVRLYHLYFSRDRVEGCSLKEPRHFLVYRRLSNGEIEIGRILHDSRNLSRHLPKDYTA